MDPPRGSGWDSLAASRSLRMWKRFMTKRDQIRRSRGAIEVVEPQVCTSGPAEQLSAHRVVL